MFALWFQMTAVTILSLNSGKSHVVHTEVHYIGCKMNPFVIRANNNHVDYYIFSFI